MKRSRIGYRNPDVPWYYGWNPGGFGCSGGCEGCWAWKLGKRMKCKQCQRFEVHLHEERLDQPANTPEPGVVLVNFTCDTFDKARKTSNIDDILLVATRENHHAYVFLTQNAERMRSETRVLIPHGGRNWHLGLTIRNQAEADAKLPAFLKIPGKLWVSYEPAWSRLEFWRVPNPGPNYIQGVIVGHDNRRGAPGTETLEHIRSVVGQCRQASLPCYVKQIWSDGKFLRASHPEEYALYPADLRMRDLPWAMPTETK